MDRLQLKKERERILQKAKDKFEKAEKEKLRKQQTGEGTWMLPVLDQYFDDNKEKHKSKKSKKDKKNKKSKKKKKSNSDSESSKWVEKVIAKPVEKVKRDDWMSQEIQSLPCLSNQQRKLDRQAEIDKSKQPVIEIGQHSLELNPYWKEGGKGMPNQDKQDLPSSRTSVGSGDIAGDGGLGWLKKSLKRCHQLAEEQGVSLDQVAAERYGSIDKLNSMISDAEEKLKKSRTSNRYKASYGLKSRQECDSREKRIITRGGFQKPGERISRENDQRRRSREVSPRRRDQWRRSGDRHSPKRQERSRSRERRRRNRIGHSREKGEWHRSDGRRYKRSESPVEVGHRSRTRENRRRTSSSRSRSLSSGQRRRSTSMEERGRANSQQESSVYTDNSTRKTRNHSASKSPQNRRSMSGRDRRSRSSSDGGGGRRIKSERGDNRNSSNSRLSRKRRDSEERLSSSRNSCSSSSRTTSSDDSRSHKFRVKKRKGKSALNSDEARQKSRDWRKEITQDSGDETVWKMDVCNEAAVSSGSHDTNQDGSKYGGQDGGKHGGNDSGSDSDTSSSDTQEQRDDCTKSKEEDWVQLTDAEMNKLASQLLKAEIMGDEMRIKELKNKLERARNPKSKDIKKSSATKTAEVEQVLLTRTDKHGNVRPVEGRKSMKNTSNNKRERTGKVVTHDRKGKGIRNKYFADDDQHSLKEMVRREKMGTAEDHNVMLSRLTGENVKLDDDYQIDDALIDKASKKQSQSQIEDLEERKAIYEHHKMASSISKCRLCVDKIDKHLIISIGKKCFLAVPSSISMMEGHCLIIPSQHVSQLTGCDEDLWEEIQMYRKSLTQMFRQEDGKDCIFTQLSKDLKYIPHASLECCPVPLEIGDMAPIYFKKALQECDNEWSQNKKVIDTFSKSLRHCVPKSFPYFAVDFGVQGGFAHIIENEVLFPSYFGREIIGGMLDIDHTRWRKVKKQEFAQQKNKVIEFARKWKKYDFNHI